MALTIALLQVILDDHMVHGRLDDPNGANNGVRGHTVQQVVSERVGISTGDVSKWCPLHPVLTQCNYEVLTDPLDAGLEGFVPNTVVTLVGVVVR